MKQLFTFSFLIFTIPLISQNWLNPTTHGSSANDVLSDIKIMTSHEILVSGVLSGNTQIGNTLLVPPGLSQFGYIAKFAEDRTPIWAKSINVNLGYSAQNPIFDFHCTAAMDNSIYVSSHFADTVGFGLDTLVEENGGTFLAQLNPDGDYVWARNFGQPNTPGSNQMQLSPPACDIYGNTYLACSFTDVAKFRTDTLYKNEGGLYLIKFNEMGDELWVRQFGGIGPTNKAYDVKTDEDGGVYITGITSGESHFGLDTFDLNNNERFAYLTKISDDGDFLWTRIGGAAPTGNPGQITVQTAGLSIAVADVDYVFNTGYFMDTILYNGQLLNPQCGNNTCRNLYLSAFDKAGNFKWVRQPNISGTSSAGYDMVIDPNRKVFLAGSYTDTLSIDGHTVIQDIPDHFMARFDTLGKCHWLVNTASDHRKLVLDARCPDSSLVVGTTYKGWPGNLALSGLPTTDNYDNAILDFSANFNCMIIATDTDEATELPPLSAYPNPANNKVYIEIPEVYSANGKIILTDMFGRTLKQQAVNSTLFEMDVHDLSSGVYFIIWKGANGAQSRQSAFVKQ